MDTIKEHISIEYANDDDDDLEYDLTLEELNEISEDIIDKGINQIYEALEKANLDAEDLDLIILAGGSSQLPLVSQKIQENFQIEPHVIPKNLMLAISYGAALYQRELSALPKLNQNIKTLGYSLGLSVNEGQRKINQLILNYDQKLPAKYSQNYPVEIDQSELLIRLVSLYGIDTNRGKELKRRTIPLPEGHSDSITVEIKVDENKLIELTAYDPKQPQKKTKLTVDNTLNDETRKLSRKKLGLSTIENQVTYSNIQQPFIGIDLGTTTSEITYVNRSGKAELKCFDNPEYVQQSYSSFCFPSVVYFKDGKNDIQVSNSIACNARKDTAYDGKVFAEFKVEDVNKNIGHINGEPVTVRDLSTLVLNKMWETAKQELSEINLKKAVITVPASFGPDQCTMTYEAAKIAGIEDVSLIDEPTAAFIYYRHIQDLDTTDIRNVLVFDFGGGTTDVAILDIKTEDINSLEYKENMFTVLANVGSDQCGGKFIDEKIYEYIQCKFLEKTKMDLNKRAAKQLRGMVEEIKVKLSETYYEKGDFDAI